MSKNNILIIGGGPAGIMAALKASENSDVTLIERNNSIGEKLKLTGGGRCNITNNRDIEDFFEKIVTNRKFLYSALYTFSNYSLLEYMDANGLKYKEEEDKKVYTVSGKAEEVVELFKRDLKKHKVNIMYNTKVSDILIKNGIAQGILTEDGRKIYADKIIVTAGGKSFPQTGSDGSLFSALEKAGHTVTELYPALIPLVTKEGFTKDMQGISMQNTVVTAKIKKKKIQKEGDMIFTHFGVSGPAILKISSYLTKEIKNSGNIKIHIDFLKNITKEELSGIIRKDSSKNVQTNLKGVVPQNFLKEIISILNLENVRSGDLKKESEIKLINYFKEMELTAEDTLSIKAAQVTSGGISVKEIDSSTMESKIIKNLYFAGEVMDIDAETGGYNLQMAFSTGYLAGMCASQT